MQKIDFFGGLHGNYLELAVEVSIHQNRYDITKPQFLSNGACHVKKHDASYTSSIKAGHWSFRKEPFADSDIVIQIVPKQTDMLIAVVNSFARLSENFDIETLEHNTISKIEKTNRLPKFLDSIIDRYGIQKNYPRSVLRNHFFSMFDDTTVGLDIYTGFDASTPNPYKFPFRSFFNTIDFFTELNSVAYYLNQNFYPSPQLYVLHQEFIKVNQGYHSELRCQQIINDILCSKSQKIKLNIIEEAWVNYMLVKQFRCYNLDCLNNDQYPNDTLVISNEIYKWKQNN